MGGTVVAHEPWSRHDRDVSLLDVLEAAGGCLLRRELVGGRTDERELARLVAHGDVLRVAPATYALPSAPPDVVAARLAGGVVTCTSLAVRLGLPVLAPPNGPHVAVPSGRGVPRTSYLPQATRVHRDRRLSPGTLGRSAPPSGARTAPALAGRQESAVGPRAPRVPGMPRVAAEAGFTTTLLAPVPLALVHAIGCLPHREVVALWDGALHRSLASIDELAALRPSRAGRVRFDAVLRAVDPRSESLPESLLRLGLLGAGLTVEPQARVRGVGYVDLLVERLVVVEVDGYAYHGDRAAFAADRLRDRRVLRVGARAMRFTFADAVARTGAAVAEVAGLVRALRRAGSTPLGDDVVVPAAAPRGAGLPRM